MGKKVLIVKNIAHEAPGLLDTVLKTFRVNSEIVDLSGGQRFPDPLLYDAVVILGGPQSANDATEVMQREIDMARRALQAELPCLGICLGLQVLVKAAGGSVKACLLSETGFFDHEGEPYTVELTEEGKTDPLFRNLQQSFRVFQLHGETVEMTEAMTLVAEGKHCRNQAVRLGARAYGLQCHFELTPGMLDTWLQFDPDLRKIGANALAGQFESVREEYSATGISLMTNFLKIAEIV